MRGIAKGRPWERRKLEVQGNVGNWTGSGASMNGKKKGET